MHDFYFCVLISLTLQSVACHNLIAVFFSFLETHKIMLHLKTDEALELTKHSIYTLAIDFSGLISIHLFMTNPNSFTETERGDPYHLTLCVPLCPRRARTLLYVPVCPSVQCSVGHWRHRTRRLFPWELMVCRGDGWIIHSFIQLCARHHYWDWG